MNRRNTAIALLALAVVPCMPNAQQRNVRKIGVLSSFSSSDSLIWEKALREGLRELGWIEGTNVLIEYRYADGHSDRLSELAADLVRLKVDIIVASVSPDVVAARKATSVIPIVAASMGDPVELGLVRSLARPGANVTGLTNIIVEQVGKRLELLKEIIPGLARVIVLWNPQTPISALAWKEIQLPARNLGVQLFSVEVRNLNDLDKALQAMAKVRADALAIMPDPILVLSLKRIADFAAKNHLPSVSHLREFADLGGLVAYGQDRTESFRRAAAYVDKILKGAKPADLPVEQPTKFELVVNLKTAKVLGLTIPQSVLARADEVIR